MALDAWLPVGFYTPDGERTRLALHEGTDWQIYEAQGGGRILVTKQLLATRWIESGLLDASQISSFEFGGERYCEFSSGIDYVLAPVIESSSPENKNEALSFAESLKATRAIDATSSVHDAIYVERLSRLLPTYNLSARVSDDVVFGTWLTGGVPVSVHSFRRLRILTNWLGASHLRDVVVRGGFEVSEKIIGPKTSTHKISEQSETAEVSKSDEQKSTQFSLAGRPELEQFINEHVVDIIENEARYKVLGIEFPSAIILHGPPGCGKTFAVERLVDYLGWPSFQIEASSVASPYIHETSKKVAEVFDKAMENAPAVLVIDEMEAFLSERQSGMSGQHHVEEVAEFLRRIPEAIKNRVLIIAMTNKIEMIDAAILRRGRFDHVVKVEMASEEEVHALLEKLVKDLPCENNIDAALLAKRLTGRPLSDVAFAVREGARLAARAGKDKLDQSSLLLAMDATPLRSNDEGTSRKIGFI
ncbi:MAG: ATP-binding protein [Candidatus Nitrotoga sp.]|nr:ATP-binding protein [Candidatus Nitrotoga sp.]MDP1856507.1 ATP-binding protein [Candidatus Nitrotoga sp.]